MLTVLIETRNDAEALASTLGSLVAGAVDGIVRDVIVHDRGSTDGTARVADHAGCHVLNDGELQSGLRRAKGEWLLVLEPGARLGEGWIDAIRGHAAHLTMPARFSRSHASRPRFLARVFSASRPLADGLLITKRQALALAKSGDGLEAIGRGLATKRLPAEISPSERR